MARRKSGTGDQRTAAGLFESAWRHAPALIVVVALAAVGGYLLSKRQPPIYQTTSVLLFSDATGSPFDTSSLPSQDHGRYLYTQADRITSAVVTAEAAKALHDGTTPNQVALALKAAPSETSDTLVITATAGSAARAAKLADAGSAGYLAVLRNEARRDAAAAVSRLRRQYEETQRQLDHLLAGKQTARTEVTAAVLQDRLKEIAGEQSRLQLAADSYEPTVQVTKAAAVPKTPVSPNPRRDAGLAALIALLIGAAAAWAFDVRAQRRADPNRLARVLGTECLGRVPGGSAIDPAIEEPAVEARWQHAVSAIDASMQTIDGNTLLITATSAEIAGRCAVSLALSAAADGRQVVLVDADQGTRDVSTMAGADRVPGLTELVESTGALGRYGRGAIGHRSAVRLLAAGRPVANPAAFYRSEAFKDTIDTVAKSADLVLLVGPPVVAGADAGVLADAADGVLLVVDESAEEEQLRDTTAGLTWSRTRRIGHLVVEKETRSARRRRKAVKKYRRRHPGPAPAPLSGLVDPVLVFSRAVVTSDRPELPTRPVSDVRFTASGTSVTDNLVSGNGKEPPVSGEIQDDDVPAGKD